MLHPWRELRRLSHVTLTFLDMPGDLLGFTDHDSQTIYMAKGLLQRQRRAVLAHELNHLRDRGATETTVEAVTARQMITLDALVDALLWSQDENELAEQLWTGVATVRDRLERLTPAERRWINEELDRREFRIP
jgi:hypothetical protein